MLRKWLAFTFTVLKMIISKSIQKGAESVLRLLFFVLLACSLSSITACSSRSWSPEPLHWQLLKESKYKEVIFKLCKELIEGDISFGQDPMENYFVAAADINDDGLDEVFLTSGLMSMSGTTGSWIGLYTRTHAGKWEEISVLFADFYSPRILPTKTDGFHDLAMWNSLVTFHKNKHPDLPIPDTYELKTINLNPKDFGLGSKMSPKNLLPHVWRQSQGDSFCYLAPRILIEQ